MKNLLKFVLLIVIILSPAYICAQGKKKILLKSSEVTEYNKPENPDVQFIKGNVVFQHENTILYCDSALLYINRNAMDAYGNVHIKASDTTQIFGDKLFYDGNTKMAIMEDNVELIDNSIVLKTKKLFYDLNSSIGYYLDNAEIQDPNNKLTSKHGYYFSNKKEFFFRHNVVVTGNNFKLVSDSLMYNTSTELIRFFGNTHITSDSTNIFCDLGWYNTKTDRTELIGGATLINGSSVLKGDTIYYDKKLELGKARKNISFRDTLENILLYAQLGNFFMKDSTVLATDSAVFITWEQRDSLYLHGDTLYSSKDTTNKRIIKIHYNVRFFRADMQGVCDSLFYAENDSIMKLYVKPCLWTDSTQISAEYIELKTFNNTIDQMFMKDNSFIVSLYEGPNFQQIKGINMHGLFKNNELDNLNVDENAETIYFIEDEKGAKTGINKSTAAKMKLFFQNSEVVSIDMIGGPTGTIYPHKDLPEEDRMLDGFEWREALRPIDKNDVFRKIAKTKHSN